MTYCNEWLNKQQKINDLEEEIACLKTKLRYQERTAKKHINAIGGGGGTAERIEGAALRGLRELLDEVDGEHEILPLHPSWFRVRMTLGVGL
jgi:hypothetical protein